MHKKKKLKKKNISKIEKWFFCKYNILKILEQIVWTCKLNMCSQELDISVQKNCIYLVIDKFLK